MADALGTHSVTHHLHVVAIVSKASAILSFVKRWAKMFDDP